MYIFTATHGLEFSQSEFLQVIQFARFLLFPLNTVPPVFIQGDIQGNPKVL